MKLIFGLIILLWSATTHGQSDSTKSKKTNSNLEYFLVTDSTASASPFSFKCMYGYQFPNGFFRTGGTSLDVGANLARFFSKKIILGVGLEYKYAQYRGAQSLTQELKDEFNANYTPNWTNRFDSIRSATLHGAINDIDSNYIQGTNYYAWSINFSPFPDRFGGILLQYKLGNSAFAMAGSSSAYYDGREKPRMTIKKVQDHTLELSFHPYKFFTNKRTSLRGMKINHFYKTFVVSFYGKKTSLNNATFGVDPLSKYVKQDFIDQYRDVYSFGVKVGVGIW